MEANAGQRDEEFVGIRSESSHAAAQPKAAAVRPLMNGTICQICGDDVGVSLPEGELFVACNACAFPVCRPCYEYERKDGTQSCPQCRKRYIRHRGSPLVDGDEEDAAAELEELEKEMQHRYTEEEEEELEEEEEADKDDRRQHHHHYHHQHATTTTEALLQGHMSYGRTHEDVVLTAAATICPPSSFPLLTNHQLQVSREFSVGSSSPEHHSMMSNSGGGGKRVHPMVFDDTSSVQSRSMDQSKDFGVFGYGSVAWKERVESWKIRQDKNSMMMTEGHQHHLSGKGVDLDDGSGAGQGSDLPIMDESRQPLSRKVTFPSSKINPYRMIIILRLVVVAFFFRYRLLNPVAGAFGLWLTSVICEIWFAVSWILDQFPKWYPINRETYLDRLSLRYEKEGEPSQLAHVDIYVSTVDPAKEPPLVTANVILSILGVDYPVDKVSCYLSDDGASMLTFDALSETSEFSRKWVPFCKKFNIEPRAPEMYFAQKMDYLKDKVQPTFVKERRAMKREYEEFKVRINALVAKAQKVPEEGWTMEDGTPWPGNNTRDHPGMIQVFLGHSGGHDTDGNELPRLVYVSREKRPGFNHHKKAGAMNALVRVSAVLTNAPFLLNLDCDHYINNSKAIREAMCFMMDPLVGKRVCYVQFPQRFDGIDRSDRYANHNTVFFDINLKGLDGLQGPVYVGTGCVFRRQALYGYDPPAKDVTTKKAAMANLCLDFCCGPRKTRKKTTSLGKVSSHKKNAPSRTDSSIPIFTLEDIEEGLEGIDDEKVSIMSLKDFERRFGQSPVFVASTLLENGGVPQSASPSALLKEAIHVISCGYEDKSEWGKEIGWIYGSVTEDILTGFKMHCRGWRSIYCMPHRPAFKGSAPINLSDRLNQVLRWALGSVEICLSRHCPLWYGYKGGHLKCLERLAYINTTVYPLTALPLVAYCTLPAICLLTGKFIIPTISNLASLWFISLFISIFATGILEMRWSGVGIDEWWRNEQFWVIGGVSAHLFAVVQGLLKVFAGIDTNFTVTSKSSEDEDFGELYAFKWTTLLIPPTTLLVINLVGVVAGIADAIENGYQSWGPLFGKLFFAFWVIVHLYPFLKGLMGRQNRTPTIVVVWSVLLASIFSLLWVRIDPFLHPVNGPDPTICGINC